MQSLDNSCLLLDLSNLNPSFQKYWKFYFHPKAQSYGRLACNKLDCLSRETLLKGKAQYYRWPPCTNLFISAPFQIENINCIFNKTSHLNEVVNCTEPSPSVSFPWFVHGKPFQTSVMLVDKARSIPKFGAPKRCFSPSDLGPTLKNQNRLERLASHQHSSL